MAKEYEDMDEVEQRDARNAEYLKQEAEQDKKYAKRKQEKSTPARKSSALAKPQQSALDSMLFGIMKPLQPVATLATGLIALSLLVYLVLKFFNFIQGDVSVDLLGKSTLSELGIMLFSASAGVAVAAFLYRTLPKVKTVHVNLIALIAKVVVVAAAGYFTYKYLTEFVVNLNWF